MERDNERDRWCTGTALDGLRTSCKRPCDKIMQASRCVTRKIFYSPFNLVLDVNDAIVIRIK